MLIIVSIVFLDIPNIKEALLIEGKFKISPNRFNRFNILLLLKISKLFQLTGN